ncbi:MAG: AAA family ATPase [Acidobacteria bacterium]|nr:AAA family ATPase [Acidobacteriota bacterium]
MRITAFHADGFGLLQDQGLDTLCPALCVFEGPNESGKSTLVDLLRFLLFGAAGPRGRSRPPLRGGRPGGRLRLSTEAGEVFVVERSEGPATIRRLGESEDPDQPREPADRWFGGLDRTTFDRVFAIGLDELQGLDVIEDEALRARLLAAGGGLGGVDLPAVLGRLDRELRGLLLLRGQRPRLNRSLSRRRKVEGDVAELQKLPERFHELVARRRLLDQALESAQERRREAENRLRRIEVLARSHEPWRRWRQVRAQVDRLEGEAGIGVLDLDALDRAQREVRDAQERLAAARERAAHLEERRRELAAEDAGEDGGAVGRIRRRREILATLRQLLQRREVLEAEHRRLLEALAHLDRRRTEIRELQAQGNAAAPLWALLLALLLPFVLPALEPSRGAWLAALGTLLGWVLIVVIWRRRQRRLAEDRRAELEAELADLDARSLEVSQEFLDVDDALRGIPGDLKHHAEAVGWAPPADALELSELARALDEAAARIEARRRFDADRAEESGDLELAEERARTAQATLGALLAGAESPDADDYRRRAVARTQAELRRREAESLLESLDALLGTGSGRSALEAELTRHDPEAAGEERARLAEEVRRLEREIDTQGRDLGALEAEIEWLGREDRLGALLLERESLTEKVREDARSWAVAALTRSVLEEARETYEQQRMPRVVRRASALLGVMTGGEDRLALGEDGLELVGGRLEHRAEGAWSSGLADQVYLALRLALAEELGRQQEALPLVLDDVLVRLDPRRRELTARALAEVAARRQVLCFTCHPESRRDLERAAAGMGVDCGLYRLEDGRLSGDSGAPQKTPPAG